MGDGALLPLYTMFMCTKKIVVHWHVNYIIKYKQQHVICLQLYNRSMIVAAVLALIYTHEWSEEMCMDGLWYVLNAMA